MRRASDDATIERARALVKETPEWRAWIALVIEALLERRRGDWDLTTIRECDGDAAGSPLLDRAGLSVSRRTATRWLDRCFRTVLREGGPAFAGLARVRTDEVDACSFLEAAARAEDGRCSALLQPGWLAPEAVATLAATAALPLLYASRESFHPGMWSKWEERWCPHCGGRPALAELRGLERERRLRCARCGADWPGLWLWCVHCGEADHRRLGSLVPGAGADPRRVDTCGTCRGYLKSVPTLSAWEPEAVGLEDLATVDLDIAALGRDWRRPSGLGHPIEVRVMPAEGRP